MAFSALFLACAAGDNYVGTESEFIDGGSPQTGTGGSLETGTGGSPQLGTGGSPQLGTGGSPQTGTAKLVLWSADGCLSAPVGKRSAGKTFAVSNAGTAPSGLLTASLGGPAAQSFIITNNTCTGAGLAIAANCWVEVVYAPTVAHAAAETATLVVADPETSVSAALVGNDVGSITPNLRALSFGSIAAGSPSAEMVVRFTTSSACETQWSASVDNADFVISSNTCAGSAQAGDACEIGLRFSPPASATAASVSGVLTVSTSDSGTATVALMGEVVKGELPQEVPVSVSPAALDFGEVPVGKSGTLGITIISSGAVLTASLGTGSAPAFAITQNACTGSLAPGATCTMQVQFSPVAAGANTGALSISDGKTTVAVILKGLGIAAQPTAPFSVSPTAVDFGMIAVGQSAHATVTVTVATPSTRPFTMVLSGAAVQDVAIESNGCAASVPAGGTCTLTLKFAPTRASTITGALHVTDGTYDTVATLAGGGGVP
jgi:hypothetical protein